MNVVISIARTKTVSPRIIISAGIQMRKRGCGAIPLIQRPVGNIVTHVTLTRSKTRHGSEGYTQSMASYAQCVSGLVVPTASCDDVLVATILFVNHHFFLKFWQR